MKAFLCLESRDLSVQGIIIHRAIEDNRHILREFYPSPERALSLIHIGDIEELRVDIAKTINHFPQEPIETKRFDNFQKAISWREEDFFFVYSEGTWLWTKKAQLQLC
jgi:hypothetical protein